MRFISGLLVPLSVFQFFLNLEKAAAPEPFPLAAVFIGMKKSRRRELSAKG